MSETRIHAKVVKQTVTTTEGVLEFNATSESDGRVGVAIIVDPDLTTEGHEITIINS
jgi:hypothetical protein